MVHDLELVTFRSLLQSGNGAVLRALVSYRCGPNSIPRLSLFLLCCLFSFLLRALLSSFFFPPQKPTLKKISIWPANSEQEELPRKISTAKLPFPSLSPEVIWCYDGYSSAIFSCKILFNFPKQKFLSGLCKNIIDARACMNAKPNLK